MVGTVKVDVPGGKSIEMGPKLIFKTRKRSFWNIQFPETTKNPVVNFNFQRLLSTIIPPRTLSSATATLCVSHTHLST